MHAFPKSLINSTKNGTEKNFTSQWLSISPNSMISFKFYVQTPFFSTFITLHLGKGHIQAAGQISTIEPNQLHRLLSTNHRQEHHTLVHIVRLKYAISVKAMVVPTIKVDSRRK